MERFKEIERNRAIRRIAHLEKSLNLNDNNRVCFARGDTFKSINNVRDIAIDGSIELLSCEPYKKGLTRLIPISAPHFFLISILQLDAMSYVFEKLDSFLIIEFSIFDLQFRERYLIEALDSPRLKDIHSIKYDPRHFIYSVNCDSDTETGFTEFVSHGLEAPVELTSYL